MTNELDTYEPFDEQTMDMPNIWDVRRLMRTVNLLVAERNRK